MSTALIKRATIDEIDGYRRRALELYGAAFDTLAEAAQAASLACPSRSTMRSLPDRAKDHLVGYRIDRDGFMKEIRQQLDRDIWGHLIQATDMERLMDHKAREQFRTQLLNDPPEASADNAYATITQLLGSADEIFRRGVAEAFAGLDRRFKTHDGFKIGSKIILEYAFAEYGGWNYGSKKDEILRDIERAFHVLDGKPQPDRTGGIIGAADTARRIAEGSSIGRKAFEAETEYFRLRAFKNGNAHLFLKRDDLVQKVNRLIAEVNGVVLGDASEGRSEQARRNTARTPKQADNMGFFETPGAVVERMADIARLFGEEWVLEPSAGNGAITEGALKRGAMVVCVELNDERARALYRSRRYAGVLARDFLEIKPSELRTFDVVLMNPPFHDRADVEHVLHALKFLRPGGRLVAIVSASALTRQDIRSRELQRIVLECGDVEDLPAGTFKESGTMVATKIISIFR